MANNPPPYSDITGISRTVMKDNAQETLVNYDGNARPGEIVADLTTDPPALYVGNNAGQLTAIAGGGGAGLPLANGTSNFNIATINSNVTITSAGTQTWTFDTTGNVTIPGNIRSLGTLRIDNRFTGTSADIELLSADNILIQGKTQDPGGAIEGGDIQINGGRGSQADSTDFAGTGGDISMVSGAGGNATEDNGGGDGGFITIGCAAGGDANVAGGQSAGGGSQLQLYAGGGGYNDGDPALGGGGGSVNINAGDSTTTGGAGSVNISAGVDDAGTPGDIAFAAARSTPLTYKELYAALVFTPVALSVLGTASTIGAGARAFVNNSNAVASGNFGAVVASGGANIVPVYSDGANWRIG
jgi:hypothetical protein